MAREDKGSATSSFPGDQDSTSLAARRARLRGTLSKQIVPPDSFGAEPATTQTTPDPISTAAVDGSPDLSVSNSAAAPNSVVSAPLIAPGQPFGGGANIGINPLSGLSATAQYTQTPAPVLPIETVGRVNGSDKTGDDAAGGNSAPFDNSPIAGYGSATLPQAGGGKNGSKDLLKDLGKDLAKDSVREVGKEQKNSKDSKDSKDSRDLKDLKDAKSVKAEASTLETQTSVEKFTADLKAGASAGTSLDAGSPGAASAGNSGDGVAETVNSTLAETVTKVLNNSQIVEMLNNLDTQVGICSVNVAQLAKSANEQLEVVRNLAELVQNQAFGEISLSLNSLSESMSAALEPMKAVGELVPAIDSLVTAMQTGQTSSQATSAKLTPDELVMSLANQLSIQAIDPWTFKCAYMAVFPSEHPADLLRKLVDLLGTQTLSGDLFRAAYDAVQAPDPPPRVYASANGEHVREIVKVVQDDVVLAQIEALRTSNDELKNRMDQREGEYAELLAAKDSEVQETQSTLTARFEEFSGRYEDQLQQKDSEISQKDSELQILRSQLDEMRDQTHSMVADLQKQLTTTQQAVEEAKNRPAPLTKAQTNFFEANSQPAPQAPTLFAENTPQANFSATSGQALGQGVPMAPVAPQPQAPAPAPAPEPAPAPAPAPSLATTQAELQPVGEPASLASNLANSNISNQAIPRPQVSAPTTPMMGSGSYGSGVRAQVFEVIVRQALAGAPWREICAGPMQVNNISPDEVEGEVKRRQALLKK